MKTHSNIRVLPAFTLVELMVVIFIIATLAVLGSLGYRNIVTSSRQAACMGNMKNIGNALNLYATDNNGFFPETTHTTSLGNSWIYAIESYIGNFDETRICPEDPKRLERLEAGGTSYILNSFIFVPEYDPFGELIGPALNRISDIPDPPRTLIAFTCSDQTGVGAGNDHTHSSLWSTWSAVRRDISPSRFGGDDSDNSKGRSNYLYADGRVESIQAIDLKRKINSGINIAIPPGIYQF